MLFKVGSVNGFFIKASIDGLIINGFNWGYFTPDPWMAGMASQTQSERRSKKLSNIRRFLGEMFPSRFLENLQ